MWSPQASGTSIIMQWGRDLPVASSSSNALSMQAVSLCPGPMMGNSFSMSSSKRGEEKRASRATIQFRLPRKVLISPLCRRNR